jgi:hypothetical protein
MHSRRLTDVAEDRFATSPPSTLPVQPIVPSLSNKKPVNGDQTNINGLEIPRGVDSPVCASQNSAGSVGGYVSHWPRSFSLVSENAPPRPHA